MKKIILILSLFASLISYGQTGNLTGNRVQANSNLLPPLDTILAPYRVGEIRTKVAGSDTLIFIAVSLSAPKKWMSLPFSSIPAGTYIGTANRISVTGSVIDVASNYAGQNTITTLGTISAGTWNGSVVGVQYGGTGANTLGANKVLVGNGTSAIFAPNNLHWDNTNSNLGIGDISPSEKLSILGIRAAMRIRDNSNVGGSAGYLSHYNDGSLDVFGLSINRSGAGVIQNTARTTAQASLLSTTSGWSSFIIYTAGVINTAPTQMFTFTNNLGIGAITSPTARIHLPAGTATASTAPLKFTAGTILTTAESGVLETDGGNNIFYTNATAVRGRLQQNRTLSSGAVSLAITDNYNHYVFTGSTSSWTLPAVSGTANVIYYIKNRGSGNITVGTTAAANEIYDSAATNTLVISAGAAVVLFSDGTYYNVE